MWFLDDIKNGLKNLVEIFVPIVDSWMMLDNGVEPREIIAEGDMNGIKVFNSVKFEIIKTYGK